MFGHARVAETRLLNVIDELRRYIALNLLLRAAYARLLAAGQVLYDFLFERRIAILAFPQWVEGVGLADLRHLRRQVRHLPTKQILSLLAANKSVNIRTWSLFVVLPLRFHLINISLLLCRSPVRIK